MAGQPLEILIRKGEGGDPELEKTPATGVDTKPEAKAKEADNTKKLIQNRLISLGKDAITTAIYKTAEFTGDSLLARSTERALNIGAAGLAIYATGWIGVGYTGVKEAIGIFSGYVDKANEIRDINFNKARLGKVVIK